MAWQPVRPSAEPTSPAESDVSIECAGCGAPAGTACYTPNCGTYDPADQR